MDNQTTLAICEHFGLGAAIGTPRPVGGGLLHRMWKIETAHGRFAVKQLNAQVMLRPDIRDWYRLTERIAAAFAAAGIPAIAALDAEDDPIQDVGSTTVLVFPWVEGVVLPSSAATPAVAHMIGRIMGRMHAVAPTVPGLPPPAWGVIPAERWHRLADRARQDAPWAAALRAALPALAEWSAVYAEAVPRLGAQVVVGHTDLDQKNVLWPADTSPAVIDWEAAGLTDPALDVAGAALAWGGLAVGPPVEESVCAFMTGYYEAGGMLMGRAALGISACIGAWLEWLEFNVLRVLDAQDLMEQERGRAEIEPTLARLRILTDGHDLLARWLE